MTFGGTTQQRASFYAAASRFVIAILCAIQWLMGGAPIFKGLAVVMLMLGIVFVVAVWTLGLSEAADRDDEESMNSIH